MPYPTPSCARCCIAEVKRQGKPYGLYFRDITGGFTTTQRAGLQAFKVIPVDCLSRLSRRPP